jgi:hypothetical protein
VCVVDSDDKANAYNSIPNKASRPKDNKTQLSSEQQCTVTEGKDTTTIKYSLIQTHTRNYTLTCTYTLKYPPNHYTLTFSENTSCTVTYTNTHTVTRPQLR